MDEGEPADGWHGGANGWRVKMSENHVFVGDLAVPATLDVEIRFGDTSPMVSARVEVRGGRPELVDLRLTSAPGAREITQRDVRGLDLRTIVEQLVGGLSFRVNRDADGVPTSVGTVYGPSGYSSTSHAALTRAVEVTRAGRGPRSVTVQVLQQVAEVYRANVHGKPTQAVGRTFNVGNRAASGYVQKARAAGLLPPTIPGKKQA